MRGRVLIVEDEPLVREVLQARLTGERFEVVAAENVEEARQVLDRATPDVVLTDLHLPDGSGLDVLERARCMAPAGAAPPVIVLTAFGSIESAVQAVKRGAYDYLTKPYEDERLLLTLDRAVAQKRLLEENSALRSELQGAWTFDRFATRSPRASEVLRMAAEVARNPATTVLIQGESGTGKEVLARAIHNAGERAAARFVAIHCGAIPDNLLESELFGHEKGAFTGAIATKRGKLEMAHGGTLFLDEIGDMPPSLQVKLLRVLQERCFERVGGLEPIRVDVRIIAATHRDLLALVRDGSFRADLFYRLNVFPVTLPPLRERPEDIEFLAGSFLRQHAETMGRPLPAIGAEALAALQAHDWPGNVRELQNVIERAVILCQGNVIEAQHLPFVPPATAPAAAVAAPAGTSPHVPTLPEAERAMIEATMRAVNFNQSEAAKQLGITRWQLRTKLERYGIRKE